jgi:O-antigen ligase
MDHPRDRFTAKTALVLTGASYLFLASAFISIAVNSLALGAMALCWVLVMVLGKRWSVVPTPLDYFFLAYVVAEILATVFSVSPGESLYVSRRILLIAVVYYFASCVESRTGAKRAAGVLLGSAVLVAAVGVMKLLLGGPGENTRLEIFQFYMTTSQLMMIALLLILPFAVHRGAPRAVRLAAAAALIPVGISLYATVTRGAYLAAAAGVVLIACVRNWKIMILLALLAAAISLFAPPYVTGRLQSIVDIHHPENEARLLLWSTGLKIFADHPVTGVGDIDLGMLLKQYAGPGYTGQWGHLHNVAIHVLVTLGALGALAVLALFVRIGVEEWRIYRRVKDDWFAGSFALGAFAVFIGFQVNGLTEWSFGNQMVVILVWITLGITLALGRIAGKEAL